MPLKRRTDKEWMSIIQECKSSGYSDIEWCRQNGIAISTFYRKLNILRERASFEKSTKPVLQDQQHVVEVKLHDHLRTPNSLPSTNLDVALRLNMNSITIDILNNASKSTIENTLLALRLLC